MLPNGTEQPRARLLLLVNNSTQRLAIGHRLNRRLGVDVCCEHVCRLGWRRQNLKLCVGMCIDMRMDMSMNMVAVRVCPTLSSAGCVSSSSDSLIASLSRGPVSILGSGAEKNSGKSWLIVNDALSRGVSWRTLSATNPSRSGGSMLYPRSKGLCRHAITDMGTRACVHSWHSRGTDTVRSWHNCGTVKSMPQPCVAGSLYARFAWTLNPHSHSPDR